jgi:hypothetical protein
MTPEEIDAMKYRAIALENRKLEVIALIGRAVEAEREACAKLIESQTARWTEDGEPPPEYAQTRELRDRFAQLIRGRGVG